MHAIAKKLLTTGLILLLSDIWLFPVLLWLANEIWKHRAPTTRDHYQLVVTSIYINEGVYSLGLLISCMAGILFASNKVKYSFKSFLIPDYRNLRTIEFIGERILTVGILFLAAPAWCFPFINSMAISMADRIFEHGPSSFFLFDDCCVDLEFGTTKILYNIGVGVTFLAILLICIGKLLRKQKKEQAQFIETAGNASQG